VGLLFGIALGSALLGAVCGGFVTYAAMSATSLVARSTKAPVGKEFGNTVIKPLDTGWWSHSFSDLDLSAELPDKMRPEERTSPMMQQYGFTEADDYTGRSVEAWLQIGAYWTRAQRAEDPTSVAKRTIKEYSGETHFESITVDGFPACKASCKYDGGKAEVLAVYIKRGNGIYYLHCQFWSQDKSEAELQWARILKSIHFLGRAPLHR
jgi:hypothetical protein